MLTSFLDLGSEKRGQDYSLDTCSGNFLFDVAQSVR